jgi:hypothetical protein
MAKMETTSYKYKTSLTFSLNYASMKTFISLVTLKLLSLTYFFFSRLTSILTLIKD